MRCFIYGAPASVEQVKIYRHNERIERITSFCIVTRNQAKFTSPPDAVAGDRARPIPVHPITSKYHSWIPHWLLSYIRASRVYPPPSCLACAPTEGSWASEQRSSCITFTKLVALCGGERCVIRINALRISSVGMGPSRTSRCLGQ